MVLIDERSTALSRSRTGGAYFLFAQRFLAPAIIRARDSGLIVLFTLAFAGFGELAAAVAGAPFRRAAHRAFMDAASFARPSGVKPPFLLAGADGFAAGVVDVPLILAQRARAAAAIFLRASGDIVRRPAFAVDLGTAVAAEALAVPPRMEANSACSVSICSEMARARFSCSMDGVLVGMADF